MTPCPHTAPAPVFNASGEPVRLICACGREWRVLPIELEIHTRRPR